MAEDRIKPRSVGPVDSPSGWDSPYL